LEYPVWNAGGAQVSEVKRITLDAGQNLDRFESRYKIQGDASALSHAVGIKNNTGSVESTKPDAGTLRTWEPVKADGSQLGCAVVIKPDQLVRFAEVDGNYLAVTKLPSDGVVTYYAGVGWSKFGFNSVDEWDRYVADWSRRINSPLKVTLSAK
jgi:pectinesterase